MSEIKLSLKNRSQKSITDLEVLQQNVATKLSTIDFSTIDLAIESIEITIDEDDSKLQDAIKVTPKRYLIFQNVPETVVASAEYQSKVASANFKLQNISFDDESIKNILVLVSFPKKVEPTSSKTAVDEAKEDEQKRVQSFIPTEPKYTLKKVIMSKEMRAQIEDALSILRNRKRIYEEWGFAEVDPQPKAVLSFWGPPGTGKTMCAQAIAHEMGTKILSVNYSEIESKYMGESPKNLDAAFKSAKENNALLFFDEADSFLGKRIANVQQSSDQAINSLRSEMLKRLEEFEGIVIFATNLVKNFDPAFQTRILRHIKFEIPNKEARTEIYKNLIPTRCPLVGFDETTYEMLSEYSDGFSGRDIRNTILDTLSNAAREGKCEISREDFLRAIRTRQESYEKLKDDNKKENDQMAMDIKNSIIEQSKRDFNAALISIALHAAWADGHLKGEEEALILELAKSLGVTNPPTEQEYLTPLSKVCEYFQSKEQKQKAIDMVCRLIAVDGDFDKKEFDFIADLCDRLRIFTLQKDELLQYVQELADNNKKWICLTK